MTITLAVDMSKHPKQGRFVGTSAHEVAFVGGIGSGKSIAGCVRALMASFGYIGNKQVLQTPNLGIITAPTYDLLNAATLRTFYEVAGQAIKDFNKNEKLLTMVNGSEILFRTASEPEKLRGPSISWWFGDEAALCTAPLWKIMIGRLRQFGQRGYAWIATTPKGRNWVWQEFVQREIAGRKIFRAKSSDNAYLDPTIIEAWEADYTGDFAAQELDGEFVAFEGLIYPEFRREVHVPSKRILQPAYRVAGVDWGFANPGVILIGDVDGDGRLDVAVEYYQRQRRIEEWVAVAKQAHQALRLKALFCDPSEPDYIKAMRDAGLPAEPANNTVSTGIQMVKNRLVGQKDGRPRLTIGPDAVNLAAEFESYQWASNRYGMRDEPVKANDHALDALRYMVMGIDQGLKPITVRTQRYA